MCVLLPSLPASDMASEYALENIDALVRWVYEPDFDPDPALEPFRFPLYTLEPATGVSPPPLEGLD